MMIPQKIKKCLVVLFILSTLIGTIKAGDEPSKIEDKTLAPQPTLIETIKSGEEPSKVQDITLPPQQRNINEVNLETLYQTGAGFEEWSDWIFDGKDPQYLTQPPPPVPSQPDKYNEKHNDKPHQA
ncbi:uncharacterized protein LOC126846718 [Adelges cooleyi]|uniref:uncharacterized protein LOC126846718 n=1 Tax=Adelges cooleyi TaxID=133065 RepID=UPI00217F7272|nr:uncharacterized protein LOC126846718 [Adelges cooleyi]